MYARERVKNKERKRRVSVSAIEGAFPILFPGKVVYLSSRKNLGGKKKTKRHRVACYRTFLLGMASMTVPTPGVPVALMEEYYSLSCDVSFDGEEKM